MAAQKPEVCKPSDVICGSHHISSSRARTHIFDVARFNDVVANTTEIRIISEIYMAAAQTKSNTILAHRTVRKYGYRRWNFVSSCQVCWHNVTSGLGGRYNATSGDIVDNTTKQVDLENMAVAV